MDFLEQKSISFFFSYAPSPTVRFDSVGRSEPCLECQDHSVGRSEPCLFFFLCAYSTLQ